MYVTIDNSIWDKSDYAKGAITKVKTSLPETTELLKNVRNNFHYPDLDVFGIILYFYRFQVQILWLIHGIGVKFCEKIISYLFKISI